MNINTISLPWCLGRQGQQKKEEETNIHQPFFWGAFFGNWQ
jgi:hypothetical protein